MKEEKKDFGIIKDSDLFKNFSKHGHRSNDAGELRLKLLELICKAGAGYYNSHTEELALRSFGLLKSDRTPNKAGRVFICRMVYAASNRRPLCFNAMMDYRAQ